MGDFKFLNDKKILIVSKNNYRSLLFSFKNNHPELDIKFMDLNEFKDLLSFTYLKDPIPYLIVNKNLEYNKAKKYAELLKSSHYYLNDFLASLYKELEEAGYIPTKKDPLDLYQLSFYNIYLFEEDENNEIISLISKYNLKYHLLHFVDLGYKETPFYLKPTIRLFKSKFAQFFYIFTKLRETLLEEPNKKERIAISIDEEGDLFYINYFSSLFKIDVFTNIKYPLYSHPTIAKKMNQFFKNKNIEIKEEELTDPEIKTLETLIKEYRLLELDTFDAQYVNLLEIIKSKSFIEPYSRKGVMFFSNFIFTDEELYITNFTDTLFYKTHQDNNVINDIELEKIHANTSYQLTKLDQRLKHNYIKYLDIKFLSRVEQHLSENIYDSKFIKELNWKDYIEVTDIEPSLKFSKEAYEIYKCYQFDNAFYDKKDGLTNSYDHSFKGIKDVSKMFKDHSFSVSQIKSYVSCPFKYYLERLIPTDDEEKHFAWKGTLIHSVLENIYDDNLNYDEAFLKGKKKYYEEMEKENYQYGKKEEIFIDIIYEWLYPIVLALRKEKDEIKYIFPLKRDYEIGIKYHIGGQLFRGSVDKLLLTDLERDEDVRTGIKKYYTVVDYKAGSHNTFNFDPRMVCIGYDIQLPLYYYALSGTESPLDLSEYIFGGVGIRHIYGSSIKQAYYDSGYTSEDILISKLKIDGLFFESVDYYSSFSTSNVDDKGKIIAKKYIGKKYLFNLNEENKHIMDVKFGRTISIKYSLEEMINDALEAVEKSVNKILNGEFEIAPISTDINRINTKKTPCVYCKYRDVCYRNYYDIKNIGKEIRERFFLPEVEEEGNDA